MMQRTRQGIATATSGVAYRAHRPDYQLALYVGLLMLVGLVTMYAIGPQRAQVLNTAYGTDYTASYFVIKQAISLAVALAAFILMTVVPLAIVKKFAAPIFVAGLGVSVVLVLFGNILGVEQLTTCTLGACRWFDLGPLGSFQPAELLKFGVLVFLARLLADKLRAGTLNNWNETIVPALVAVGTALLFVVVFQKDLGTGITIVTIVASMMLVAGVDRRVLGKLALLALAVGSVLIVTAPHRMERVATFFQTTDESAALSAEERDSSYHITHAKIAIGSGGLMGVGIGNSVQATGYLPEAINDSVFAILGETFGFVGLVGLIVLFTFLLLRILRIADYSVDPWYQLIAAGVFGWVASHVVLNVASMLGVFPLTGITLPLLSFGGTSMVFIAAAMGLVFAVSRYTQHFIRKEPADANSMRGRGVGRTRHTSRRRS